MRLGLGLGLEVGWVEPVIQRAVLAVRGHVVEPIGEENKAATEWPASPNIACCHLAEAGRGWRPPCA